MRSVRIPSLGLALVAAGLGGCTALAAEEGPKARRVCINTREINSITALDDQHAFVKLSAGRYYLFTVDKTCQGGSSWPGRSPSPRRRAFLCDGLTLLSFDYPAVGPMRCRIRWDRLRPGQGRGPGADRVATPSRVAPQHGATLQPPLGREEADQARAGNATPRGSHPRDPGPPRGLRPLTPGRVPLPSPRAFPPVPGRATLLSWPRPDLP